MTEQLLPFEQESSELKPRRRHKRGAERVVREASLEAYAKVRRAKIYREILQLLADWKMSGQTGAEQCLTAREILRALKEKGTLPQSAERNNVSPRLTELLEAGCIEQPDYRKVVRGQAAAGVWRITPKGQELLRERLV